MNENESAETERVRPFSNGSQGLDWLSGWCDRCAKGHENNKGGRFVCEIEDAIGLAFCTDGTVPIAIAQRMGADPPGWREYECTEFEPKVKPIRKPKRRASDGEPRLFD